MPQSLGGGGGGVAAAAEQRPASPQRVESASAGGSADSTGVSAGASLRRRRGRVRRATKNAFSADRKGALPGTTWPPSCSWITGSANRDASARATSGGTDASVAQDSGSSAMYTARRRPSMRVRSNRAARSRRRVPRTGTSPS